METNLAANDPQAAARYFEDKIRFSTGPAELEHAIAHGRKVGVDFNLIDIREADAFARGHIPGAVNLPEGYWSTLAGLSQDRMNLIYGDSSVSHVAARAGLEFASAGYSVMELDGGFDAWKQLGFTVDRGFARTENRPGLRSDFSEDENEGRFSNESLL